MTTIFSQQQGGGVSGVLVGVGQITQWSVEEDRLLIELVSNLGTRWALIAHSFQGRTAPALKNRFLGFVRQGRVPRPPRWHFHPRTKVHVTHQHTTNHGYGCSLLEKSAIEKLSNPRELEQYTSAMQCNTQFTQQPQHHTTP
eukprot:c13122_g2_i7.p1 GENE.c13122_g2_i7~~c13122_g2_i7.p1  ORF type:complete len:153 (-),score=51.17 c13122_g2_i7:1698-2123(-)